MEYEGLVGSRCAVDTLLTRGPARLVRIVPVASADGGDVTIYDGIDANGKSLGSYYALQKQTLAVELDIKCHNGIYVDIGSNLTTCLVVWEPLSTE